MTTENERIAEYIRDTYGLYPVEVLGIWRKEGCIMVRIPISLAHLPSAEQAAGDPPSKCVHYRGTYCARDSRIKRTDDVCAKCRDGITAEQLVGRGAWV